MFVVSYVLNPFSEFLSAVNDVFQVWMKNSTYFCDNERDVGECTQQKVDLWVFTGK